MSTKKQCNKKTNSKKGGNKMVAPVVQNEKLNAAKSFKEYINAFNEMHILLHPAYVAPNGATYYNFSINNLMQMLKYDEDACIAYLADYKAAKNYISAVLAAYEAKHAEAEEQ